MSTASAPRQVLYCNKCGMPPEYCEYGPDFESHCLPWLRKTHPDVYQRLFGDKQPSSGAAASSSGAAAGEGEGSPPSEPWTTEQRLVAFYTKYMPEKLDNVPKLLQKYDGKEEKLFTALVDKYGPEPEDPYVTARWGEDEDDEEDEEDEDGDKKLSEMTISDKKKKRRGVSAKKTQVVETRVVIQKISRNKRKAVTIVVGLDTVPDLNLKEAAKAFRIRFAGSSSVKDTPQGGKEIIIQGDHMEDCASMIVSKFKVKAENVFLDMDGEFVPFGE